MTIEETVEQVLSKLLADYTTGIKSPDNVRILVPSLKVQEAKQALLQLIRSEKEKTWNACIERLMWSGYITPEQKDAIFGNEASHRDKKGTE